VTQNVERIIENININKIFEMQIDEAVEVSDKAELISYIRYFYAVDSAMYICYVIVGCK